MRRAFCASASRRSRVIARCRPDDELDRPVRSKFARCRSHCPTACAELAQRVSRHALGHISRRARRRGPPRVLDLALRQRRTRAQARAEDGELLGFVCVLLDTEPEWGARLDNLHVSPEAKGTGIGYVLFNAAREWIADVAPGMAMHLWCVERNYGARRFYERQGGKIVETATRPVAQDLSVPELRYWWPPMR